MRGMNSESVDLIYLDPPFNSNANDAAPIGSKAAGAEFKDTWSMNFVSDRTGGGERFRALTVVDVFTRESLAIEPGKSLRGADVVKVLSRIVGERGAPKRIYCDNGSEFVGRLVDLWAYANGVQMEFSRPGKPTDNAFIESFNGSLRDECLNLHWFDDLTDAREKLQAWRREYNENRPHRALDELSPLEFKAQWVEKAGQNFANELAQKMGTPQKVEIPH